MKKQKVVATTAFKTIPNDCVWLIIMFVTVDDQNAFSLVCKNVRQIWLQTSHGKLYQSIVNLHNTLQHSSSTLDLPMFAKYSQSISNYYNKIYTVKEAKQYLTSRLEFLEQTYRNFAIGMIQELEDVKVLYEAVEIVYGITITSNIRIKLHFTTVEEVECSIENNASFERLQTWSINSSLHTKWEDNTLSKSLVKTFTFFMNQLYAFYEAQGKFGEHFDAENFFKDQEAIFCIDDENEWSWVGY